MKSKIIWGVLVVGIIVTLIWVNGNKNTAPSKSQYSAGAISIAENTFDFGRVPINGGDVMHEFQIKNDGAEPVTINKVYTSCACTTARIIDSSGKKYGTFGMQGHTGIVSAANIKIDPGSSATLEAIFNPAAHGPAGIGLAQRSIYIETNSREHPKTEASFRAVVTQ